LDPNLAYFLLEETTYANQALIPLKALKMMAKPYLKQADEPLLKSASPT
jgi:hypothetical protein